VKNSSCICVIYVAYIAQPIVCRGDEDINSHRLSHCLLHDELHGNVSSKISNTKSTSSSSKVFEAAERPARSDPPLSGKALAECLLLCVNVCAIRSD